MNLTESICSSLRDSGWFMNLRTLSKMTPGLARTILATSTFRDLWLKQKWGPLTIFMGKQIVEWGESLAFRIADESAGEKIPHRTAG